MEAGERTRVPFVKYNEFSTSACVLSDLLARRFTDLSSKISGRVNRPGRYLQQARWRAIDLNQAEIPEQCRVPRLNDLLASLLRLTIRHISLLTSYFG